LPASDTQNEVDRHIYCWFGGALVRWTHGATLRELGLPYHSWLHLATLDRGCAGAATELRGARLVLLLGDKFHGAAPILLTVEPPLAGDHQDRN